MFKSVLSTILVASLMLVSCKGKKKTVTATKIEQPATTVKTAAIGVRGNCNMCKKTIETAALGVAGVTGAVWNKATKQMEVKFSGNIDNIHNAIAASGYDTEKVSAKDEVYNNLPGCCQYDRNMELSTKKGENDGHDDQDDHEESH